MYASVNWLVVDSANGKTPIRGLTNTEVIIQLFGLYPYMQIRVYIWIKI